VSVDVRAAVLGAHQVQPARLHAVQQVILAQPPVRTCRLDAQHQAVGERAGGAGGSRSAASARVLIAAVGMVSDRA
jgi:hypothetical protein